MKLTKKTLYLYFLLYTVLTFAQDWEDLPTDPGFGGGTGDPATEPLETPIDQMIVPFIILAIIVAFYIINKKKSLVKN
jgi:hypothetical protein